MLESCSLVKMDDGFTLQHTGVSLSIYSIKLITPFVELGRLMARYYVAFESMKRFLNFKGKETLADMVSYKSLCNRYVYHFPSQVNELSQCKEFEDVRLRVNEKRVLNTLNRDKIKPTIRYLLFLLLSHAMFTAC